MKIYIQEDWNRRDFLSWKRKNVTLRGISNYGEHNNAGASFGQGLYMAYLSNVKLARQYGDLYFVINGRPKNPKKVRSWNEAEIFVQKLAIEFCEEHGKKYLEDCDNRFFNKHTSIEAEMLKRGYDGLDIVGREVVNYKPNEDEIRYIPYNEPWRLENYYDYLNNSGQA